MLAPAGEAEGQRQAKKIPFHQVEAGLVGEALSQQPAQIPVDLHRHHLDTLGQQSPRQWPVPGPISSTQVGSAPLSRSSTGQPAKSPREQRDP
jgi:hypothetical protein